MRWFVTKHIGKGLLAALTLVLSACGGGGGGSPESAPASTTTTTAPGATSTMAPGVTSTAASTTTTPSTTSTTAPPTAPAAPALSLAPQSVKTFRFTWADVAGETQYRLLEQVDNGAGYVQVATIAANATSHEHTAFLPRRLNARYILQACNDVGCADSVPVAVSGNLAAAVGYIKASNTDAGDEFGFSVALSADGSTLAVGAYREDSSGDGINGNQASDEAADSGAVYVFARNGTAWSQQAYIKASNSEAIDRFGSSVALSADGNTLAVGALGEGSNANGINGNQANNLAPGSGAAYVYTRSGNIWSQQAYVKASNTDEGDAFGRSVALSGDGNTLAVGAYNEDSNATGINGNATDNSGLDNGAVYVFVRSGGTWSQQAYVKASMTDEGDAFGSSVALSADGNTLAVGAYNEASSAMGVNGDQASNAAFGSGAVYVFTRNGSAWSQQAYVKASNTDEGDAFGASVALSADGNTLAVGADGEDSGATGINGDPANNSVFDSGAVYVFFRSGGSWSQQAYVKASNPGSGNGRDFSDGFGSSLALSADGSTLAVGAAWEDSSATGMNGNQADNSALDSGAVYVFTRSGSAWSQRAYVKAPNTNAGDFFGRSVALAGDGNTLAAGAAGEDSGTIGINGNQGNNAAAASGAAYLY